MRARSRVSLLGAAAVLAAGGAALAAQALPTSQPNIIQIYREQIKAGHAMAHKANESGWPEAFAQAGSTDYYLAMESMTGRSEVWFVAPFESYAAVGKSMEQTESDPVLSAALGRLAMADAEHLDGVDVLEAVAVPELSHGQFPDLNRMRFWEISIWRIRPGHERRFAEAAAAYKQVATKAAPDARWRMYRVTAGLPDASYISFSSVVSFGEFDEMMASGNAVMQAASPEVQTLLSSFMAEGAISLVSNKYRLDPSMSYVSAETKATDPAFWNKK